MAEKIDRKQLKRPDEFQVVAGRAMEWIAARQRQVLAAVVAVALAAIGAWALSAWRSSRESKAGAQLAEALELQSRPIAGEQQAQVGQETFASKEERDKAAAAALEKVRTDHRGTTAGKTAQAELGFLKLRMGDAASAQKELTEFLSAAPKDHPLRVFAQESLGYAFEAQGKIDDARAAFDKLRDLGLPARADFQGARLSLLQGKPDARQQLERIAKEYPKEEGVVREANARLEISSLPPVPAGYTPPAPPAESAPPPAAKNAAKKPQAKKTK